VGQDPFLFNDTIRSNVLFGRNDPGEDIIKQALRKADVLDFVESLPGGLDYIVADDGMKMSGGQRQRICIARALLKNPEILLLDEATSALDHKTEEKIIETILRIVKQDGNTVIFVTHRKSAIQQADQVIEVKDGQILRLLKSPGEIPVSAEPGF
jgi:ABC-type multidrug transport system fused ATPase/permease subunit